MERLGRWLKSLTGGSKTAAPPPGEDTQRMPHAPGAPHKAGAP